MSGRALVNARILPMRAPPTTPAPTVQPGREPWGEEHEGIVWSDGIIRAVGSRARIEAEAARLGVPVEDAKGAFVLPGFVDAHTHFLHIGVKATRPNLAGAKSRQDALARVAGHVAAHPGSDPVIAELWDESDWPDKARPTRAELDRLTQELVPLGSHPERPLVLRRVCGHVAVANSAALAIVRRRWSDPDVANPDTGVLLEDASLYLNEALPLSPEALDQALDRATRASHALGITTVGDYSQAPYREALLRAARAGTLRMRVASSIYVQQLAQEAAAGFATGKEHSPFLRDGGVKVFLDGSLGARTAALRAPYADAPADLAADCKGRPGHAPRRSRHGCVGHPHPKGTLNWSDAEVARHFHAAAAAGIQVHAHAIGDAAIDQGLAMFGDLAAVGAEGRRAGTTATASGPVHLPGGLRHRFEHFEVVHPEQAAAVARLGLVASSQPNFVGTWSGPGGMYDDRLGPRRGLNNRFRDFLRAGIPLAFGSDAMPPGPLAGLVAASEHPEPDQRMSGREAAWHYTWWAAWSLHWEDRVGSLEPGKDADLVLVDGDPDAPPATWRLRRTVLAGETVWQA